MCLQAGRSRNTKYDLNHLRLLSNYYSQFRANSNTKDVEAQNFWHKTLTMYPQDSAKRKEARDILQRKARDNARTPVQWNAETNAGFCEPGVEPWMRVNEDCKEVNAAKQVNDQSSELSVFQFWKRGFESRKTHKEVFVYGGFEEVERENESVFAYLRTSKSDGDWLVVLNFTGKGVEFAVPSKVSIFHRYR